MGPPQLRDKVIFLIVFSVKLLSDNSEILGGQEFVSEFI